MEYRPSQKFEMPRAFKWVDSSLENFLSRNECQLFIFGLRRIDKVLHD
jgi:hypothetical protein